MEKKRTKMGKKTRKEGEISDKSRNFRWSILMDRLFLEILADEATTGNKPSSSFKPTSFNRVAQAINQKFGCECSPLHVENHLRTSTISLIRGRSGYGWNANLNIIICDKQHYDEDVTLCRCPINEKYLNKKIDMYEEMALAVSKDIATCGFSKSYETQIDSTSSDDDNEVAAKGKDDSSTTTSSRGRQHGKRKHGDEDTRYDKLAKEIGQVALAIKQLTKNELVTSDLYDE
ncbi:hypothetical protein RJ640_027014 [Escallonia rubra]|uniref:Myb/SANT-like domain-containing protein n=1 Tax=Escallonia rubra TaxID=112253 RepID=A0AA88QZ96_9ASTE|nr:hypothetical protein RJ640_027014 [Escallonia rubra]